MLTPKVVVIGANAGVDGQSKVVPLTIAALNTLRATAEPEGQVDITGVRYLPTYKTGATDPAAYASEPYKDGGV